MANGTSSTHTASETCEREKSIVALPAAPEPPYCGSAMKWEMKGVAKPLVIWRHTPARTASSRNCRRYPFLKRVKARSPVTSGQECPRIRANGVEGSVSV